MGGGGDDAVRAALQHVARVDDDLAIERGDRQPATVAREQLQPTGRGLDEQRDQVDVLVRGRAYGAGRRVVRGLGVVDEDGTIS